MNFRSLSKSLLWGILELATPPQFVMSSRRTLHWFCTENFIFLPISGKVEFLLTSFLGMRWLYQICKHFWHNDVDSWLKISYKWNFVKNYVQNLWRVLHTYITNCGGVANSKIPHNKDLLKLQKVITLEPTVRFCSNFHC